jgi:hypothetical protein
MKKFLPVLKIGASKDDYPHYASYVNITGGQLQTCNKKESVVFDLDTGFEGSVNIYVLEDVLKNTINPDIEQIGNELHISEGDFRSILTIEDIGFPQIKDPSTKGLKISDDIINTLKTANVFTGTGIYNYIYLGKEFIVSTDGSRMFFKSLKSNIETPIPVNSSIISTLNNECVLASSEENAVVVYKNGYIIFTVPYLDTYPIEKITNFIKESRTNLQKICNVAVLQDAIKKVSSVFIGESVGFVSLENKDNTLGIKATSEVNGTSFIGIASEVRDEFKMSINCEFLKGINLDFDVYVDVNNSDRLYLKDLDGAEVVLLAAI